MPKHVRTALEIGQGVRGARRKRADVFITSKLNNGLPKPDDALRAFDNTLRALEAGLR